MKILNLLIKDIFILSPKDNIKGVFDVLIINGVIEKIGAISGNAKRDIKKINGSKYTLIPGLFDMHVHFRDPGQTEKEDLFTGAMSAANGGFTGVLCMPNTKPPVDNEKTLKYINKKAKGNIVDIYTSFCASVGRKGEETTNLDLLFRNGGLAVTDDGSPLSNMKILEKVLKFSSNTQVPFLQHAENPGLNLNGAIHEGRISKKLGIAGIPYESEVKTIKNDIKQTKLIPNSRYHLQHVSCGESIDVLRKAKKTKKCIITSEVCPHHFILTDDSVLAEGTNAKMNPPLRNKQDIMKIISGIKDDTIDVICTDHAPHTIKEKSASISEAPFGIIGLETCVGLTYYYLVDKGFLTFEKMIEKMSDNPRKILNLPRIRIAEGEKANMTLLDVKKRWRMRLKNLKTKSRNTPFKKHDMMCKPVAIINNNQIWLSTL
jgi:dihydroorotase